ncbi:MAG: pilus assembly protein [Propionibacteriaceae bacterium]|nr:pilus assembly protein [Actinomycetota bacterium]MCW5952085.1 pilus assembly protein [Propionibacteriaceae bacterium]
MITSSVAHRRLWRGEQGAVHAVELLFCAPLLVAFLVLVVLGGRIAFARQAVHTAAVDAVRAASIARSASAAETSAEEWAQTSLANQGINCVTLDVTVDTAGFSRPVGTPARVALTVRCDVYTGDLVLPGVPLPGSVRVEQTTESVLDTYRSRR